MAIVVDIDVRLAQRHMSVGELARAAGITPANLAVLKNGRARAIRFSTLEALCAALDCQPGDILRYVEDNPGDESRDPGDASWGHLGDRPDGTGATMPE